MQSVLENRLAISDVYAMRCSGATLQQIANTIGRSKEAVRQMLLKNYGSSRHGQLSMAQLCKLSGFSRSRVMKLYHDGVIAPAKHWTVGLRHYYLWSQSTLERLKVYARLARIDRDCRICGCPVPPDRYRYCSEQCYKESLKYRHRSPEARRRHLLSVKKYREARRQPMVTAGSRV